MFNRTLNMPQSHRQSSIRETAHSSSVLSVIVGLLMSNLAVGDDVYMASPPSPPAILDKSVEVHELSGKKDSNKVIIANPPQAVKKILDDASNRHRDINFEHAYILRKLEGTERTNRIFQQTEDSALAFAWSTITARGESKAAQETQYDLWTKTGNHDHEREWAVIEK